MDHKAAQDREVITATSTLGASVVVSATALLVFGLLPIMLGSAVEMNLLTERVAGSLALVEILAIATGAAIGVSIMNGQMRLKVVVVAILLAAIDVAAIHAASGGELFAQRLIAGLLEGALLGSVNIIGAHSRHPDRMNGLVLGLSPIPQAIAAYAIPVYLTPRIGPGSVFLVLAAGSLFALLVSPALVDRVRIADLPEGRQMRWSGPLKMLGLGVLVQNAGMGAVWGYIERVAIERGFSASTIGTAIGASLICQIVAALAAAWGTARVSRSLILTVGCIAQIAVVCLIAEVRHPQSFIVALACFSLVWPSVQPAQVTMFIVGDPSRRAVLMLSPLVLLGSALGPAVASLGMSDASVTGGIWIAVGLLILSFILHVVSVRAILAESRSRALDATEILPLMPPSLG